MPSAKGPIQVQFQPTGKRVNVPAGVSLLQAARSAGIELTSDCGGEGSCGQCQVVILSGAKDGAVSEPAEIEGLSLGPLDLISGRRLACSTTVLGDLVVEVPRESVISGQRLQVESQLQEITPEEVDPPVRAVRLDLPRPRLADSRADFNRVMDALVEQGFAGQTGPSLPAQGVPDERGFYAHPSVLRALPEILREENWQVTAYVRGDELVGFGPVEERALGLCVDLGTTKIAASLVDLATGRSLGSTGAPNPQMGYGEDVISRINHVLRHPETAQTLAEKVQKTIDDLLGDLLAQASKRQAAAGPQAAGQQASGFSAGQRQPPHEGRDPSLDQAPEAGQNRPLPPDLRRGQVVEACIVGNNAMIHLLLRLPVRQLSSAPYIAAVADPVEVRASELGLEMAPGAYAYIPPNVGGFVGADHVAMVLACGLDQVRQVTLGIDIGTNTEIVLRKPGEAFLTSASCASGPAFEGAHISEGMRAASGAIEKVRLTADGLVLTTIDQDPPVGLCGSGIVDTLAELHRWGLINRQGSFQRQYGRIRTGKNGGEFVLAYADQSGTGRDIVIDQKDVNEIQLAKGAIHAGLQVLLEMSGTPPEDVQEVIIAGAFGSFLNIEHAAAIGLFPHLPNARFRQVGNAALVGARWLLVSKQARLRALQIQASTRHQHLNAYPRFNRLFAQGMLFPDR